MYFLQLQFGNFNLIHFFIVFEKNFLPRADRYFIINFGFLLKQKQIRSI